MLLADGGWLVRRASGQQVVYDPYGLVVRKADLNGRNDVRYTYSDESTPRSVAPQPDLLVSMRDQFGRILRFAYDAAARMTSMTDPAGRAYRYRYDASDNLSVVTYPDGAARRYHYEASNVNSGAPCDGSARPGDAMRLLTGITDAVGQRVASFAYDCDGKALSTELANGVGRFSIQYDASKLAPVVVDPLGASRSLTYQKFGKTIFPMSQAQSDAAGAGTLVSHVVRDTRGNIVSSTDFNGNRTCAYYDPGRNLPTATIEGLHGGGSGASCPAVATGASLAAPARLTSTQWHDRFPLPTKLARPGMLTTYVYNGQSDPFNGDIVASCAPATANLPSGDPIAVLCRMVEQATTDANGSSGFGAAMQAGVPNRIWRYAYNANSQILTTTDAKGGTTHYSYWGTTTPDYTMGDLASVTNALGQTTTYDKYNAHGQLLQSTDPNGVVDAFTYDLRQRLTRKTVAGQSTLYTYNAAGLLTQVVLPDGNAIHLGYDPAHRLIAVTDARGNSINYTLDGAGNRIAEQVRDASGGLAQRVSRIFDSLGRQQKVDGFQ